MIRKIDAMYARFGKHGNGKCADCPHYTRYRHRDKPYRKCKVYGISCSEATDWTGKWDACGMFDKEYTGPANIMRRGRDFSRPVEREEIEGQMQIGLEETNV